MNRGRLMKDDKYKLVVSPNSLKVKSDVLFTISKPLVPKVNEQTGEVKFYLEASDLEKIKKFPN